MGVRVRKREKGIKFFALRLNPREQALWKETLKAEGVSPGEAGTWAKKKLGILYRLQEEKKAHG